MTRQAQRQRETSLLALGAVGARGHAVERDPQFVAMRSQGRQAPSNVHLALRTQCLEQIICTRRLIDEIHPLLTARELLVGGLHRGGEPLYESAPDLHQPRPGLCRLGVPHIQSQSGGIVESPRYLFQQRISLAERLLPVTAHRIVARVQRHGQIIEVVTSQPGRALHQGQVIG